MIATKEEVVALISQATKGKVEFLDFEVPLTNYQIDSIDLVVLLYLVEEKYGIHLTETEIVGLSNGQALIELIRAKSE